MLAYNLAFSILTITVESKLPFPSKVFHNPVTLVFEKTLGDKSRVSTRAAKRTVCSFFRVSGQARDLLMS